MSDTIPAGKTCTVCGAGEKFYRCSGRKDGLDPRCTTCAKALATISNKALAALRDRHYDEYLKLREMAKAGLL